MMSEKDPTDKENHELNQFDDVLKLQPLISDSSFEAYRDQNASLYRILLENLAVAIVVHALDTSVIMCNQRASELLGLSKEQMSGKVELNSNWKFVDLEMNPLALEEYPVNRVIKNKTTFRDQILGICRPVTNDIIWVLVNGMPVLDSENKINQVIISFIDISERIGAEGELKTIIAERKITQEKLRTEALYSRTLLETSQDSLVTINPEGKLMDVNLATEKITGVSREELIGSEFSNYFTNPEQAQEAYHLAYQEGKVTGYHLAVKHISGKITEVLYNASVFRIESGKVTGVFAAVRDISSLKQLEDELNQLNLELEQRVLSRTRELEATYQQLLIQINDKERLSNELKYTNIELARQYAEKEKRASELEIANIELAFQNTEKAKRASELEIVNQELAYQNAEKEKRASELEIANQELAFQNTEKEKRASELEIANIELAFQNTEKAKRASELEIANQELAFQNAEKEKRASELEIANQELAFQNKEKEKRASELEIANQELAFQNAEKQKRASELEIANHELAFQNAEKEKRASELEIANQELAFQNAEKEKRMAELIYLNNELDTFSYSVAHDLRGPLRHMEGFVDLLQSKFYDILPDKAKHYLDSIADSSSKMGLLIDDLLEFSRTGKQEMHKELFDLNELVQEALHTILSDNQERSIEWQVSTLPHVFGDKNLLSLVWINLLDNAVKFTSKVSNPQIHINVCEANDEFIFSVHDNGVGFDMQYADKLFGVFQRMHPIGEFEGIGIGLANVHRIILKHGGRTWAEAEVDKGAVFYFSLPIIKED